MPTFRKPKFLDAQGKPLAEAGLYEPISDHGRGYKVFHAGTTVLRGDDLDVVACPSLWISTPRAPRRDRRALSTSLDVAPTCRPSSPTRRGPGSWGPSHSNGAGSRFATTCARMAS